ncbi:hypothetical protein LTR85_005013 [Meristemomyces frigidus]|nr:hypothetical protein LTR85_005013 [Meristemomyces frigidus]
MKRKFSFDIPRLRIGPSKADTNALRQHLAVQIDSPPPTPKSVRPPLSPVVEADLRAACAYVLQNFKPSHVVYQEQYGGAQQKQQLDYAAIKESTHSQVEDEAPRPLSKVSSGTQEPAPADVDAPESEGMSPDKYRYRPDVATEDLFKNDRVERANSRRSAILRAEQLMLSGPPKVPPPTTRERSGSHLRSVSAPWHNSVAATTKNDVSERPRTAPRSDSMETTGSTPQTDSTDYPWSDEKASTAMTSAVITPARSSKRTSSQALQSGSEASSMPKVEPVDADWMRVELEKHKKAQEARLQQEKEREEAEVSPDGVETTPKQVTQAPTPIVIRRKPVPASRSASKAREPIRADSRQSSRPSDEAVRSPSMQTEDVPRSVSRQDVYSPRSDSRQGYHPPRAESRQESYPPPSMDRQARGRAPSRARSITRQVKDYIRSNSTQRTVRPDEISRPASRAGTVTRQVKEYFRPGTAMSSRKPSMDLTGPEGRSLSIDSYRSAQSGKAPSFASTSSKWRNFKPFHRRDASRDAAESSRPGTSGSTTDSRGRAASRDARQSPQQQKAKPAVDLNRKLPPLPSLDQWKAEEAKPKHPTAPVSPVKDRNGGLKTPRSHRSGRSKADSKLVAVGSELGERDEILAARMGSPTPPRSHHPSVDLRSAPPPQPTIPPPTVPNLSANITGPDDFDFDYHQNQLGPTVSIEPCSAIADMKKDRRRSRSIRAAFPSELHDKVKNAMGGQQGAESPKSTGAGKAHLINYSRVAGGPLKGGLSRSVSKAGHVAATTNHTPVGHSRNNSNYSRKFSMDDYTRMHDNRYANMVEISAPTRQAPPAMPVRDKKWWQKMGKKPSSPSWMDQVVKSGSRSGVLLTDEVAGAPIVRY